MSDRDHLNGCLNLFVDDAERETIYDDEPRPDVETRKTLGSSDDSTNGRLDGILKLDRRGIVSLGVPDERCQILGGRVLVKLQASHA